MPEGAVYVGRPTRWGNPFRVGIHGEAGECVEKFRKSITAFPSVKALREWVDAGGDATSWVLIAGEIEWFFERIRGKDLACWCPLDKPCHVDVLLELVNL